MKKNSKNSILSTFPWHVILCSIYSSLALWAYNVGQIGHISTYRAIFTSLLGGVFLLVVLWLWLRDPMRAGIAATLLLIYFSSYGHVYSYIKNAELFSVMIGRHRFLALFFLILSILSVWWSARKLESPAGVHSMLNVTMTLLLIFPIYSLSSYYYSDWLVSKEQTREVDSATRAVSGVVLPLGEPPDIYYIILDGYGRSNTLLRELNLDNSVFLTDLRNIGFYIAECSQSNYGMTALSLSSSLNMNYLPVLGDEFTPDNTDRYSPLWQLIKNSAVESTFEQMGYQMVAFETGYDWTEFRDAEYFFQAPQRGLSGFESLLLRDSAAVILDDFGIFDPFHLTPEDQKRNQVLYVLDEMKKVTEVPGPKFVFIHLVVPHQPFVFGPNGEPFVVAQRTLNSDEYYSPDDYLLGYGNQVKFISKEIPELMALLVQKSSAPPVIVIQGDHGPAHLEKDNRMAILNAIYFPHEQNILYSTITPVNTFRLIFNTFFEGNLDLLPDVSYYSTYARPYDFETIPNTCASP